jgi:hypothetical protein
MRTEIGAVAAVLRFECGYAGICELSDSLGLPICKYSAKTGRKLDLQRVYNAEKVKERAKNKQVSAYKSAMARREKMSTEYAYGSYESETPA